MDPITEKGVAQSRVNFCKKYNFKSLELYFKQIKHFFNFFILIKKFFPQFTDRSESVIVHIVQVQKDFKGFQDFKRVVRDLDHFEDHFRENYEEIDELHVLEHGVHSVSPVERQVFD